MYQEMLREQEAQLQETLSQKPKKKKVKEELQKTRSSDNIIRKRSQTSIQPESAQSIQQNPEQQPSIPESTTQPPITTTQTEPSEPAPVQPQLSRRSSHARSQTTLSALQPTQASLARTSPEKVTQRPPSPQQPRYTFSSSTSATAHSRAGMGISIPVAPRSSLLSAQSSARRDEIQHHRLVQQQQQYQQLPRPRNYDDRPSSRHIPENPHSGFSQFPSVRGTVRPDSGSTVLNNSYFFAPQQRESARETAESSTFAQSLTETSFAYTTPRTQFDPSAAPAQPNYSNGDPNQGYGYADGLIRARTATQGGRSHPRTMSRNNTAHTASEMDNTNVSGVGTSVLLSKLRAAEKRTAELEQEIASLHPVRLRAQKHEREKHDLLRQIALLQRQVSVLSVQQQLRGESGVRLVAGVAALGAEEGLDGMAVNGGLDASMGLTSEDRWLVDAGKRGTDLINPVSGPASPQDPLEVARTEILNAAPAGSGAFNTRTSALLRGAAATSMLNSVRGRYESAEQAAEDLRLALAESEKEREVLQSQIAQMWRDDEARVKLHEDMNARVAAADEACARAELRAHKAEERVRELEQVVALQSALATSNANLTVSLANAQADAEVSRNKEKQVSADLRAARTRVTELQQQLASVTQERETYKVSLEAAKEAHKPCGDSIARLQERVAELEGADAVAVSLRKDVTRLQWLLDAAAESERRAKEKAVDWEEEVGVLSRRLESMKAEVVQVREVVALREGLALAARTTCEKAEAVWGMDLGGGKARSRSGVTVKSVVEGGPADVSGLRKGDRISSMNGKNVNSKAALAEIMSLVRAGESVVVSVDRRGTHCGLLMRVGGVGVTTDEIAAVRRVAEYREEDFDVVAALVRDGKIGSDDGLVVDVVKMDDEEEGEGMWSEIADKLGWAQWDQQEEEEDEDGDDIVAVKGQSGQEEKTE